MTDEEIERLVTRIVQRLQPPVLVMVAAADGYRQAIHRRLAGCGHPLHIVLDDDIPDAACWQETGAIVPPSVWQEALPAVAWRAAIVPFLDYPLAADLTNGSLRSPFARRLHETLLSGLPVLALRYHCDPDSELNQLYGAATGSAYAGQMRATLARLTACCVTLCDMNELLERLRSGAGAAAAPASAARRYLTVTDVVNNPALAAAPDAELTDAAIDFLKNRKKEPYLNK